MRFVVFTCRKCGHKMYVENTENLAQSLKKLAVADCPTCGEERDELWLLSGLVRSLPDSTEGSEGGEK